MDKHQSVVQEWLDRSEQDFEVARDLFSRKPEMYAEPIAFHLQQCVEKLLKALLVKHRQPVPKIHDLEALAEAVNKLTPGQTVSLEGMDTLTVLGIAARYPGISVSPEELKTAFDLCIQTRQALLPYFLPEDEAGKSAPCTQ